MQSVDIQRESHIISFPYPILYILAKSVVLYQYFQSLEYKDILKDIIYNIEMVGTRLFGEYLE